MKVEDEIEKMNRESLGRMSKRYKAFCDKFFSLGLTTAFHELTDEERKSVLQALGSPCVNTGSLDCARSCCDPYAYHGEDT